MNTNTPERKHEPSEHDYLWDAKGTPDRDIAEMERTLGAVQYRDDDPPVFNSPRTNWIASRRRLTMLATAAVIALAALGGWWWTVSYQQRSHRMQVNAIEGTSFVGSDMIRNWTSLDVGDEIETKAASRARINVGKFGYIDVDEHSQLTIERMAKSEQRLALVQGRIEATISAPPRLFIVDTPATTAVDLGCIYTLDVAANGDGLLEVEYGAVSLETSSYSSYVPGGAKCPIDGDRGPGTPYFIDASPEFIEALAEIDRETWGSGLEAISAWKVLLRQSRPQDTLSLWNLIPRVNANERQTLLNRISELVTLPTNLDPAAVLAADADAMEQLRIAIREAW